MRQPSDPPMKSFVQVSDIHKRFGDVVALDGVSMSIAPGSFHALLGPNGAGKSTLMAIIAGLLAPDRGAVQLGSLDPSRSRDALRKSVGYAPQHVGLYPVSVVENLRLFAIINGVPRSEVDSRVSEVAQALGLGAVFERSASYLSGGERRRVHAAITLLSRASVLILDEIMSNTDIEGQQKIMAAVNAARMRGASVVYSTHNFEEVEALGEQIEVTILDSGSTVRQGSLGALLAEVGSSVVELRVAPGARLEAPWVRVDNGLVRGATALWRASVDEPVAEVRRVLGRLSASGIEVTGVEILRPSLRTLFLEATGRHLAPA